MKKIRYIPFGYRMQNGELALHEQEAAAIKLIFNWYLQDNLSYKAIADLLTKQGIPYRENTSIWNKSMVKRILENSRYIGKTGYPAIISEDDFQQVPSVRAGRSHINGIPAYVTSLKKKILCYECGGSLKRHTKASRNGRWYCDNPECETEIRITDEQLLEGVTALLNSVIADPSLVDQENTEQYNHSLEATRLTNAINRELEKTELNEDYVKALIMRCAAEKYDCCSDGSAQYLTETLKAVFKNQSPLGTFNIELFERAVQNIWIEKDGAIHVRFTNQKTFSFRNEERSKIC